MSQTTTPHYDRVKQFMQHAGQSTPETLTIPDANTRVLRAKLILEEALETISALGVSVRIKEESIHRISKDDLASYDFLAWDTVDIEGVADGVADISVVSIGTLIAFGIKDDALLREVDAANLRKFGPGHYKREDGKLMKPADWTPPNIKKAIGLNE